MQISEDLLQKPADTSLLDPGDDDKEPVKPAEEAKDQPEPKTEEPVKSEEEAKTESDVKTEAAKPEEKAAHAGSATVPHSRFNEVNEQLKAERAARAELESQLAASKAEPAPDIAALTKERNEALYGGDVDKATEIDLKIMAETQRIAEEKAFARSEAASMQREAARDYQQAYAQCVKDYPFLAYTKDESGNLVAVNQEAVDDTVAIRDLNVAKGMSGPEALIAAAKVMAKVYSKPAEPLPDNVEKIDKRTAAAIARGAEDAKRQPPALVAGVGARAIPAGVAMPKTQHEYESLSVADREKLLS